MKTQLLSLLAFLFIGECAFAQTPFYEVKTSTAPYQEITNPTWLEQNPQSDFAVPSLPGFYTFGKELDATMIVLKDGWVLNSTSTSAFSFAPFLAYRGLYARPSGSSMSAMGSIEPNGDTIIKIQWKNMGLVGNDSGDYANFQLWLYKKSQTIEFRYGASRVTDTAAFKGFTGPAVDIMLYDTNYSEVLEVHKLVHDPANPKDTADAAGISSQLNGPPANGTVYTFSRRSTVGVKPVAVSTVTVYPNPVNSGVLTVELPVEINNYKAHITNALGQIYPVTDIVQKGKTYEITLPENLADGIYQLTINADGKTYYAKVQVSK